MTGATYYEGAECARCGSTRRYRNNGRCVQCSRMFAAGMRASEIRGVTGVMTPTDAPDTVLGNDPQQELRRIMTADAAYLRRMHYHELEPEEECVVCGDPLPPHRQNGCKTCSPECARLYQKGVGVRPRNAARQPSAH